MKTGWSTILGVIVLCSGTVSGQVRTRYQWRTPGHFNGLRDIGGDLGTYGAGVGGLRRTSPVGSQSLLRSSISKAASYDLKRTAGAGGGASGLAALARKSTAPLSYKAVRSNLAMPGLGTKAPRLGGGLVKPRATDVKLAGDEARGKTIAAGQERVIHSLVPVEPSDFQERMARGEMFFRSGRYHGATETFHIANAVARFSPESHLSMVHARFALAEYHQASYHLQRALEYFPELPLVQLELRKFYGEEHEKDFDEHYEHLRKSAQLKHADVDELLVLAYVQCFDGKAEEAVVSLRRAYARSFEGDADEVSTSAAKEAIEVFWDGMAVMGKASGTLPGRKPTSRSADKAAPEKPSPKPKSAASSAPPKPAGAVVPAGPGKKSPPPA